MFFPQTPSHYEGTRGKYPTVWWGDSPVDGTKDPWCHVSTGSLYILRTSGGVYKKVADNRDANDWDELGAGGGGGGLATDGSQAGGTASSQEFTNGVEVPTIQPVTDGATALQIQDASGNVIVNFNTSTGSIQPNRGTDSTNVFIGNAGNTAHTSNRCVSIGEQAGVSNTSGQSCVYIGYNAGNSNTSGSGNVALGSRAGNSNTTGGSWLAMGDYSGYSNVDGNQWVAIGYQAAYLNTSGNGFVAAGHNAARNGTTATDYVALGKNAAYNGTTGSEFVAIGRSAAYLATTAEDYVAIGRSAGYSNTVGNRGIYIGAYSGYNETASDKLHIGNNTTTSLIEGTMNSSVASQSLQVHAEEIIFADLPTSDPVNAGALWNDSGTLKVSAG